MPQLRRSTESEDLLIGGFQDKEEECGKLRVITQLNSDLV